MRGHLIRRVVLALIVAVGGGTLLSALTTRRMTQRTVAELVTNETLSLGSILAYEVMHRYQLSDEQGLTSFIEGVQRRRPELVRIVVVDNHHRVVASSQSAELGQPLHDDRVSLALAGRPPEPRFAEEQVSVYLPLLSTQGVIEPRGVLVLEQSQKALIHLLTRAQGANVLLEVVAALLTAVGLGLFLHLRVVSPIRLVAENARQLAARDLSTPPLSVRSQDELGELIQAFSQVSATTRELIGRLKHVSSAMREASQAMDGASHEVQVGASEQRQMAERAAARLEEHIATLEQMGQAAAAAAELAEDGAQSAEEIAASSDRLVTVADRAAEDVEISVQAMEEVASSLRQIFEEADRASQANWNSSQQANRMFHSSSAVRIDAGQTAELAAELAESASQGSISVAQVLSRIHGISDQVKAVDEHVQILNPALERIVHTANEVSEIADQTRVLALNASILAAQAGQAGAGFEIVASRVKELSSSTRDSAREIAGLALSIEKTAPVVMETVRTTRERVREVTAAGEQASGTLERIVAGSDALRDATARIVNASEVQVDAAKQLMTSATAAVERVGQLTHAARAQRAGTERLEKTGEALRSIARVVDVSAREQAQLAQGIAERARTSAERFGQLGIASLSGVRSSRELAESSRAILQVSEQHAATVKKLENTVDQLVAETESLGQAIGDFKLPEERREKKGAAVVPLPRRSESAVRRRS